MSPITILETWYADSEWPEGDRLIDIRLDTVARGGVSDDVRGGHLVSGQQYSMLYDSSHKNSHNSLKS